MMDFADARQRMVERQIERRGITDARLLAAMRKVPREQFVPEDLREFAYDDTALPIELRQTISQPFIVAEMIAAAQIAPQDMVLEIGTGSGYAAAILAELAARVVTIERHPELAKTARERLEAAGYTNIEVIAGDGTLGWAPMQPYQAIIAAAGGPTVPEAWRDQLALGGRLIMPVGDEPRRQQLVRITRADVDRFEEEILGEVMFVPLIGAQGWMEDESAPAVPPGGLDDPRRFRVLSEPESLSEAIRMAAESLPEVKRESFGAMFDRWADRKVVLLGEASHGTAEFYQARAAITKRLIEKHGFNIVAAEADWPDAAMIDRYVRHRPAQPGSEPPFRRFPTWMWRNTDVEAFTEWLRAHNEPLAAAAKAGFYGLDLYNMHASITAVLDYLKGVDPEAAEVARQRYGCLTPWQKDPAVYGRAVITRGYRECEPQVLEALQALLSKQLEYSGADGEAFLDAAQNARLVASAERYYRIMYYGGAASWNLRDTHMFETLENLIDARGPDAKAVVWAHNSHIGDARYTEMGVVREELNLGQLCRQKWGDAAALIGFGTHGGEVACATDWDGPMEVKAVRPSLDGSYEALCHATGNPRFLLDLSLKHHEGLRQRLVEPKLERFIGVIYRPETERLSHYVECSLPRQFDGYVWFDETSAVEPLITARREGEVPETWPFGY